MSVLSDRPNSDKAAAQCRQAADDDNERANQFARLMVRVFGRGPFSNAEIAAEGAREMEAAWDPQLGRWVARPVKKEAV